MDRPKKRPKASDLPSRRRVVRIAAICFMVLGILVTLAFQIYQGHINQFFESMVQKNLLSTHESQVKEAQTVIREVRGTLESVATIYKTSSVSPESDWSALPGRRWNPHSLFSAQNRMRISLPACWAVKP